MSDRIKDALTRAANFSPFLAKSLQKNADIVAIISRRDFDGAWKAALAIEGKSVSETLRRQRNAVALVAAIADLAGYWDVTKITHSLSDFADYALDKAIEAAFDEYLPDEKKQGFAVIALGKHGGRELNYSSDIDPIFLYDPATLVGDKTVDHAKIAVRMGKYIIALLNERTEHDYVFRVDMRLRPASEITPVVISVNAAISHYESSALAWEQAAFIRARAAAGDIGLGQYFLNSIDSFIWRRSLDFGQINNIRKMSQNIRDHYSKGQFFGMGYDIKRGRGGIRECEFYAQIYQLIHGGRNAALRVSDTRDALRLLTENGHIDDDDAKTISDGYTLLRTIEHRLQMVDDRQTHILPTSQEALDNVAQLHGLSSGIELLATLEAVIQAIRAVYDALVQDEADAISLAEEGVPLLEQLDTMGYDKEAMRLIQYWRSGKYRALRSEAAIESFESILPAILTNLAASPDPQKSLTRLDRILEQLPSAVNFFHLLQNRPAMLALLGNILSYAPTLADALGRNATLLDGIIDSANYQLYMQCDAIISQMDNYFDTDLDYQMLLDAVQNFVSEKRFVIGVQLIEGRCNPYQAARAYSALAEAAIDKLSSATIKEFEKVHGTVEGGELVIISLGRFGGKMLTHDSDLDIIFLFTGDFSAQSDGDRPLGATQYFNRLAQRIIAALSLPTMAGKLYEIDTRLRPSGAQGLLSVSIDSFEKYQHENAWTWEHMALTRARLIFGSKNADDRMKSIIANVVSAKPISQYHEILSMRRDMDVHKPAISELDVKNIKGGLIDIEFIVHALQLHHAKGVYPNIELSIEHLCADGLLPNSFIKAHKMMSNMLIILRLICPNLNDMSQAAQQLMADNLGYKYWSDGQKQLEIYQNTVQSEWAKLFLEDR